MDTAFEFKLQATLAAWKKECQVGENPDWQPLEKTLPPDWWGGWMFMGRHGSIRLYKHGISRRYLNLDGEGNAWVYRPDTRDYAPCDTLGAVMSAYTGIERMGASPSTVYDSDYRARRDSALEAAGYKVIS